MLPVRRVCFWNSPFTQALKGKRYLKLPSVLCLILLLGVSMSRMQSQTLTGEIEGTVTDATGGAIPDASVTVSSPALITGTRSMHTDGAGYYKFLELPPGTYTVHVEKQGFNAFLANGVVVDAAVDVTSNAKLSVGNVAQQIVVNANAATIDPENVSVQAVLGQQLLEGVPTGRSPWANANMVPAVMPNTYDVGGSAGMQAATMIVHGSTVADQRFMIDGVNVNWPGAGGGSTAIYYDQGMFQEINFRVGALPAEIGTSGVYMNMVTGDGSNQIHGTIFANGAGMGMQSDNIGGLLRAQLLENVIPSERSNPLLVLGNPTTLTYDYNAQLGGPLLKDKLWYFGSFRFWAVNNLVSGAFNDNGGPALNDNLIANESLKFSYQLNPKNKLTILYSRNQKNRYHRRNTPPYFVSNQASFLQNQPGSTSIVKWTLIPNSRWVVDTGVGLMHLKFPQRYQPTVKPSDISVQDTALSTESNAAQYNYINPNWRLAIDSSASTLLTGPHAESHSLKFGIQYSHDYYAQIYTANGDLQGVLINNVPSTATIYNTPLKQQNNNLDNLAFYGQDEWKIFPRFTLDLGVRWEWLLGTIPAQTSAAGTFVGARSFAAIHNVPNWKSVTPRLGFAWDLTGKGNTVVKGSFSQYEQGVAMDLTTAVNPLGFSTQSVPWKDLNGDGVPEPNELNLSAANGFVGGSTTKLDPNVKRPNSWEQSLGVEQRLPLGLLLSVTGWHRSTSNQIGRQNVDVPSSDYTPVTIKNPLTGAPLVVYNQLASTKGHVAYMLTNSRLLNFDYRGIDFDVRKSLSQHWLINGGISISRLRGAVTGDLNTALDDLNNPNYNYNRLGEQTSDSPFQAKFAMIYNLPYKINLSGNFQHATGYPVEETYSVTSTTLGQTLTQVSQTIVTTPSGPIRLSNINLLDLRLSRVITFHDRYNLQPEFDMYNSTNSAAVTAVNQSINNPALALNPTTVLPPRLYKVGMQFKF